MAILTILDHAIIFIYLGLLKCFFTEFGILFSINTFAYFVKSISWHFCNYSLLVYKNMIDFAIMILYSTTLYDLIRSNCSKIFMLTIFRVSKSKVYIKVYPKVKTNYKVVVKTVQITK